MKNINVLSAALLLTVSFAGFGQEQQPTKIKKIRIHDVSIQAGSFSYPGTKAGLADFKTLFPETVLLNNNVADFSQSSSFNLISNSLFSALLGFQLSDKQNSQYKPNPVLRFGISYFSGSMLQGGLFKMESKPYDTLTSSQTGQAIYIDSVYSQNYSMDYTSKQFRLDASLIFKTNPQARWSLYAGIGLTAGVSINAHTEVYYSKYGYTQSRYPNGRTSYVHFYQSSYTSKTETFRNKTNFAASTYLPMGIDFRIAKKGELWKRVHLYYELRPSVNMTSIAELRMITDTNLQHALGLRILCTS
ncbi:MAG: hypothetical protein KF803_17250 [Cyclobacteriaceae bacterium]|nr:hypothetical protein [Cyclobacteriaceae bacterium]